ncbi:MAG: ATP-dependent metallopeptidase FtsH/Yme1/Tma family protein, partial [Candidatus Ornithomonoglobus sp.]
MNEVKKPKKPLIYYYGIAVLVIMLFNLLLMPKMLERQIKEVDYGTFMDMTEERDIGHVQIQSNQIIFTDKEETTIYKTGLMDDFGLVNRLHEAGAVFSSQIIKETSPLLSFLLSWILPMVIFILLGQFLSKKMMNKAGGPNSMMFNMGKSNA